MHRLEQIKQEPSVSNGELANGGSANESKSTSTSWKQEVRGRIVSDSGTISLVCAGGGSGVGGGEARSVQGLIQEGELRGVVKSAAGGVEEIVARRSSAGGAAKGGAGRCDCGAGLERCVIL